ncbi:sialidase-2-like isoform X2 [Carcharodon carcharias]|uniref:sialidase-2-like isoform X2 n=1 Tax=Carcharodon carcharias TaxID=13397 RepID=UPI001B7E6CEF|nr:sialidase-2-like isoform X2 [Carcharodon carcharias]
MASSTSFNTTVLFKQEKSFGYRIPALLHIPDTGTLLAFAEKRLGSRDEDADALMLRRGTYKKALKNFEWEDVTAIESARLKKHRSMNPCPVYDKDTGTVFLFFIAVFGNTPEQHQIRTGKNVTRLCFVTSKNKGQNWSNPTNLTDCTIVTIMETAGISGTLFPERSVGNVRWCQWIKAMDLVFCTAMLGALSMVKNSIGCKLSAQMVDVPLQKGIW